MERISPVKLDNEAVKRISAYLASGEIDYSPKRLASNPYFSLGSKIYGQGFLFADDDPACTPLSERERIIKLDERYASRIHPYLVGEELNGHPSQKPRRFVIYLSDIQEEDQLESWELLRVIVEQKVKPERLRLGSNPNNVPLKRRWWAYQAHRPDLYNRIAHKQQVLCISRVGQAMAFAFCPTHYVFSEMVVVFDIDNHAFLSLLQSRLHEVWARNFSSSFKDDS